MTGDRAPAAQKKDLRKIVVDTLNRRMEGIENTFVTFDEESRALYNQVMIEIKGQDVILHFALNCPAKRGSEIYYALRGFHPQLGNDVFIVRRKHDVTKELLWDDEAVIEHAAQTQVSANHAQQRIEHERKMQQLKSGEAEKDIEF